MAPKRRPPSADLARLTVLAAGDERAFLAHALELIASGGRLGREAALPALVERPLPAARGALLALYDELDANGSKLDQGTTMRQQIITILRALGDTRDARLAARASDNFEKLFGEDIGWPLRVHGLRMLAEIAPDVFPYYAIEHLDDVDGIDGEPANSAFQLLAGTGHYLPIYHWLISGERDAPRVAGAFELLAEGPREIAARYAAQAIDMAIRRGDETLSTVLAEAIVNLEIADSYPALATLMSSKISEELYNYVAVLLAGTNRPPLLAILEHELTHGHHRPIVEAALRIRTTPEQAAILKRRDDAGE
jgi:hypothetical protein